MQNGEEDYPCRLLPEDFFTTALGSANILAVTLTYTWGTDIDNNGKQDTALAEIYYTDKRNWRINANYDVETVALHEAGHALSQAHFGEIFRTDNGKLRFVPRAVMNAAYSSVQQELTGTDVSGHCSIWGSWPLN